MRDRPRKHLIQIIEELKEQGVGVFFEEQKLDTSVEYNQFLLSTYAALAQEEIETISGSTNGRNTNNSIYILRIFIYSASRRQSYQNRVSGPIKDRIDMILPLHPVNLEQGHQSNVDSSSDIRERVQKARKIQYERAGSMVCNANLSIEEIRKMVVLSEEQKSLLQRRASKQNWSNRVQMKMIRLARTVSDIRGEEEIADEALWEAMALRRTTQLKEEQKKGKWRLG